MIWLLPAKVLLIIYLASTVYSWSIPQRPHHPETTDRRAWLSHQILSIVLATTATIGCTNGVEEASAVENGELPMALRSFTKLAPLSPNRATSNHQNDPTWGKTRHLPTTELAARLQQALTNGATGKGSYIVTGDLPVDLFREDCSFIDPTNRVDSLQQYQKALTILFDPETSHVDLVEPLRIIPVKNAANDDGASRTALPTTTVIQGRYRCRGTLKLPWKPVVAAFESTIVYTVDPDSGLVAQQEQKWTKSAATALQETFTPGLFTPVPRSERLKPNDEPVAVTRLFDKVNGRRQGEYSSGERMEIDALIDSIASFPPQQQQQQQQSWRPDKLYGKWKLVYLRAGPSGVGVDRRVPFPELPFNDSYQIFAGRSSSSQSTSSSSSATTLGTITNLGELWGAQHFYHGIG